MKIYFAASIRGGRDDKKIYANIINILQKHGTVLTEHIGNQDLSDKGEYEHLDELIFHRDMQFLEECNIVVAEVTTPSLGVGYEIARAENIGKPVLCLFRKENGKRLSAMIAGNNIIITERYKDISEIDSLLKKFIDSHQKK